MFKHLKQLTLILIIVFSLQTASAAEPVDIANHWAQDYILNLVNNEVMDIYSDGTFKPEQNISRGEFAVSLARQLSLLPDNNTHLKDLAGYPEYNLINALIRDGIITGYPDETFRPDNPITRAEMVTIMIKALGVTDEQVLINLEQYQPFDDISNDYWASDYIKIAERLQLVKGTDEGHFLPKENTSRAEAAKCLSKMANLVSGTGYLTDVYPTSQKVSINLLDGQREIYNYTDDTLVARNNRSISLEEILETDKVFVIADNDDNVKYVKAYGMVTQEDLAAEISNITNGVINTDEVEEISKGNLEFLKPKVRTAVKDQLIIQGLSIEEVEAIMSTDWDQLESLSRDRLSEAIAIQTGLPLDITTSLLSGDWEKIKSYAQIEVVQRLVLEVLNSDFIS